MPLLPKLLCNQSCGNKQMDMLSLLLGRSRPGGQLVKVFSASLVRIVRATTRRNSSRHRQHALQAWTYHWTCCHGKTKRGWLASQLHICGTTGMRIYIGLEDAMAHSYYGTPYMGTGGR